MASRWPALLVNFCILIALAHSAAVPTQDTLVVFRSDDAKPTAAPITEVTTEGPLPPIKMTELSVVSNVSLRYAHTTVTAHMRNPASRAQQGIFRVLLPETAFISGFVMTIDGKSYTAYVKEKEEAKQIYQEAIAQGLGAAHISAKARDSNHFIVAINIEPLSVVLFNLTYEELLVRRSSVYHHAMNLHPGTPVPKLTVTVNIKESEKITELRVPEVRTGNEIDATENDAQNSKVTIVKSDNGREATITFQPDLEEQERLIQIYTQKSKESAAATSHYTLDPEEETPGGVLGQFVVQYDVARPKEGEILVNEGYFVHFFAPTDLPPLNKFVVFVLDTSGSMYDRKINQLREAMQVILSDLNPGDYFTIVDFDNGVTVHDLKEAEGEPPKYNSYSSFDDKTVLVPPYLATPENIAKAKVIVNWLKASGGTNIEAALDVAVQLIKKGIDWKPETNETATAKPKKNGDTAAPVNAVANQGENKKAKSLEPIIIFLTDGEATVGEINTKKLTNTITEKNDGPNKATLFTLAFGDDADRKFLRKVAYRNGGFSRHIYEAADAALQLHDFYRQIASPLLSHVKFTYSKDQVKENTLTKHDFRTLYAGSELVVAGRVTEDATEIAPSVSGFCGVDDGYGRKRYDLTPKAPVENTKQEYLPLERLWSYLTIKQLLEQREAAEDDDKPADEDKENTPEKKALKLALKYSFVTPVTSLVVVKPNSTSAVNAESVDKPGNPTFHKTALRTSASQARLPVPKYDLLRTHVYRAPGGTPLSGGSFGPSASFGAAAFSALPAAPAAFNIAAQKPMYLYDAMSEDYDYEEKESAVVSTTPRPVLTTSKPDLSKYHLEGYPWTASLLDDCSDALVLSVNGTTTSLKLVKDLTVPKEANCDAACATSLDGGAGVCVYLTRCESARQITLDQYATTYCSLSQGYAGVCCPPSKVDVTAS